MGIGLSRSRTALSLSSPATRSPWPRSSRTSWKRSPAYPLELSSMELVALDDHGRPEFNLLQNFRGAASRIHYYIFDLPCCESRDVTGLPLVERRALLKSLVRVGDKRIRIADYIEAGAGEVLAAVREQGLEGMSGRDATASTSPGNEAARGSSIE